MRRPRLREALRRADGCWGATLSYCLLAFSASCVSEQVSVTWPCQSDEHCSEGFECETAAGVCVVSALRTDAGAVGPHDAGRGNEGARDSGPDGGGEADAGRLDAGPNDAGAVDAGATDAGRGVDAGSFDAGALDAGDDEGGALDAAGPADAGDSEGDAGPTVYLDCLEARRAGRSIDGSYRIDPDGVDGGAPPLDAWCDMTTAGGGWTLVYAYTFTNYAPFDSTNNAVTPRPTWPYTSQEQATPLSTTLPVNPLTADALDYARWSELGSQLLVTSTINHWLLCLPGTGDLASGQAGTVSCSIEQVVATACTNVVPTSLSFGARGPSLRAGSLYYYWDASTDLNWPTHDPCGDNDPNQLTGVADPRGALYLRAAAP